jgi:hypothetical protein
MQARRYGFIPTKNSILGCYNFDVESAKLTSEVVSTKLQSKVNQHILCRFTILDIGQLQILIGVRATLLT